MQYRQSIMKESTHFETLAKETLDAHRFQPLADNQQALPASTDAEAGTSLWTAGVLQTSLSF